MAPASRGEISKPLLGKIGRRLDQLRPRQPPVQPVRQLEQGQRPRHADRAAAGDGVVERHRRAVRLQEQVRPGRQRRGLAPVEAW